MKVISLILGWLLSMSICAAQEPTFETGVLDGLTCNVVDVEEAPFGARLLIEVRNSGAQPAEPLGFLVSTVPKKKKDATTVINVERVGFPYALRFGRAVPARGKERYWVQVAAPSDGRFEARVTRASFWSGAAPQRPEVVLGKLEQCDIDNSAGQAVRVTCVHLENPEPRDVDLVFAAEFQEPRDGRALLGVRIRASSERDWIISSLPTQLQFANEADPRPTRVTKLELLDWCWVGAPDPEAGARLFLAMDENWVRWDKPYPGLTGRFRYRANGADHDTRGAGTFRLDAEGRAELALEAGAELKTTEDVEKLVRKGFEALFADVHRPSGAEVSSGSQIRCVADDAFELEGPGWWRGEQTGWGGSTSGKDGEFLPNFSMREGRLCRSGNRRDMGGYVWETQTMPGGWVVVNRRNRADQWNEAFGYTMVDTLVVPNVYRRRFGFIDNGPVSYVTLELSDLSRAEVTVVADEHVAPQGAGVEALRAAWDFGYRYPSEPRELTAEFEIRSPATDMVWQGQKEVRGSLRLNGYRGFLRERSGWRSYHIDIDGKVPEFTRSLLASAVDDRLRLWSYRDFNGRSSFDETFAGSTIGEPSADGTFEISGGRLANVVVRDGRVIAQTSRSGATIRYSWSKVGDQMLVTRTQSGLEDLRVKFSKVGTELVPTSMEFQKVFGDDWGTETVMLSAVKIE